jgi:hypothetical protein
MICIGFIEDETGSNQQKEKRVAEVSCAPEVGRSEIRLLVPKPCKLGVRNHQTLQKVITFTKVF